MARESAEEKIARIVRETMAGEKQRQDDESNPQIGTLRRIIREEVGGVLGELLSDKGDGGRRSGSRRQQDDDEEGGGEGIIETLLFGGGRKTG